MKTKSVEYGRVINLGNYENHRLSIIVDLDEGETLDDAVGKVQEDVMAQLKALRAAELAEEEAERRASAPLVVTPDMVAEQPTLRDKARRAAQIALEQRKADLAAEARKEALNKLGVDLEFKAREDGAAIAQTDDGLTLVWQYNQFAVFVPVKGEPTPRKLTYVHTREDLGQRLAPLEDERTPEAAEDIPF